MDDPGPDMPLAHRHAPEALVAGRNIAVAFAGLYATHFVFLGTLLPFFSGWLALKGFSASAIGLINGVALGLRLLTAPVIAVEADRQHDQRRPLIAVSALFALCAGLLALIDVRSVVAAASIGVIWGFGLLVPLTDSMVLRADRRGHVRYGQVRAVGSGAFLLANIAGGVFLQAMGLSAVGGVLFAAAGAALVVACLLPPQPAGQLTRRSRRDLWREAGQLMRSPVFVLALLAAGLTQASHAVYYAFSILHWSGLGYTPSVIGWLWATGVLAEIALLAVAHRFTPHLSPGTLMVIGGMAALVRWSITATDPSLPLLFLVQTLHALTFGAAYLGAVEFIGRSIPPRFVNTGMILFSTTGVGALTGLATVIAGYVLERGTMPFAYGLMAGLGAMAILFALILRRFRRQQALLT